MANEKNYYIDWAVENYFKVNENDKNYCYVYARTHGLKKYNLKDMIISYECYNDEDDIADTANILTTLINEIAYYIVNDEEKYGYKKHIIDDICNNYHIIHSFSLMKENDSYDYIDYDFDELIIHPITGKAYLFNPENCTWLDMHEVYEAVFPDSNNNPYK